MHSANDRIVILMTACVFPEGKNIVKLSDPTIRKKQYLDAIEFYLRETKCNIVFCENSGTNIYDDVSFHEKERLEYLTFSFRGGEDKGTGYGEAKIIEYAIRNSQFIRKASGVIKITGRVRILNINEICRSAHTKNNRQFVSISFCSDLGLMTSSVCFLATKEWLFDTMVSYIDNFNNLSDKLLENYIYIKIVEDSALKIFRLNPIINGICAGINRPYGNIPEFKHKHGHFCKLYRIYKSRNDRRMSLITWSIWHWYSLQSIIIRYFSTLEFVHRRHRNSLDKKYA